MRDYTEIAANFAENVVDGSIISGKYVRLSCQNFLNQMESQPKEFYYDAKKAHSKCYFMEQFHHVKGRWAAKREKITLEPWQCYWNVNIFGWMRNDDDLRRYSRAMLMVARKNGKSLVASATGLAMLAADWEYGAEVYCGATTERQAMEVFNPSRLMAMQNEEFMSHYGITVQKKSITVIRNGSKFEPVVGDPGDGSNPSLAIIDEYHEHKTDRVVDTMLTGMGAREQPLMLIISTAGDNISGPCYQMQKEAERVLDGVQDQNDLFALLFVPDKDDEWDAHETMLKANPNYGVSVGDKFLKARLADAKANIRKKAAYQIKHLNMWVGSRNAYYDLTKWQGCSADIKLEDYYNHRIIVGVDLASRVDIAAISILIPCADDEGKYMQFSRFFLPEETVNLPENEHYRQWRDEGWLIVNEGKTTDINAIKEYIEFLSDNFELSFVGYDPAQATVMAKQLSDEGINCVEVKPTVLNFSQPMKDLDAHMRDKSVINDGNPAMTWMVGNVVAKEDAKDNVYPRKELPESKIDGVIAHLMAVNLMDAENESILPDDYNLAVANEA